MKVFKYILVSLLFFAFGWYLRTYFYSRGSEDSVVENLLSVKEKPLEKYSIENLSKSDIKPGTLRIKDVIKENESYNSYLFEFEFSPDLSGKTKKTTGQINLPKTTENSITELNYPTVIMFRGYIDQSSYKSGDGTRNAANYFARNGFVTIAPDFLGYGGSDEEAGNIFETRFQTYTTALSLIKTVDQIVNNPLLLSGFPTSSDIKKLQGSKIFFWAHSNGGQIALTTLEAAGVNYPTALWAPVSKPFPYSILYYTDQSDDRGKLIRRELAKFEEDYDVEKYSLSNYFDKINAPILVQQGTRDDAIPLTWSEELNDNLKSLKKDIELITYPGADHDMRPSWNEAVEADLKFYLSKNI